MKLPPDPNNATQQELEEWLTGLTDEQARKLLESINKELKRRGEIAGKAGTG